VRGVAERGPRTPGRAGLRSDRWSRAFKGRVGGQEVRIGTPRWFENSVALRCTEPWPHSPHKRPGNADRKYSRVWWIGRLEAVSAMPPTPSSPASTQAVRALKALWRVVMLTVRCRRSAEGVIAAQQLGHHAGGGRRVRPQDKAAVVEAPAAQAARCNRNMVGRWASTTLRPWRWADVGFRESHRKPMWPIAASDTIKPCSVAGSARHICHQAIRATQPRGRWTNHPPAALLRLRLNTAGIPLAARRAVSPSPAGCLRGPMNRRAAAMAFRLCPRG